MPLVDNAGTYTVTITDINGCTANASTTVIVNESTATITPLGAEQPSAKAKMWYLWLRAVVLIYGVMAKRQTISP